MKLAKAALAAVILLVTAAGIGQETSLSYRMDEGVWVSLHVWLPRGDAEKLLPPGFEPAVRSFDPLEQPPPGQMADCYFFIRSGNYKVPLAGRMIDETNVLDAFTAIAVKAPQDLVDEGTQDFFMPDYFCDNQPLITLLGRAGLQASQLRGEFASLTLPSLQQQVTIRGLAAGAHEEWEATIRSTDERRYDIPNRTLRLFFTAGDALHALEIHQDDDFYLRADSRLHGFADNNPLDKLGEWRWSDRHTMLHFTMDTSHEVHPVQRRTEALTGTDATHP